MTVLYTYLNPLMDLRKFQLNIWFIISGGPGRKTALNTRYGVTLSSKTVGKKSYTANNDISQHLHLFN